MTRIDTMRIDSCSVVASAEPLAGSSPFAQAWIVVEHPGPWGRDALTDSGIPETVIHHVEEAEAASPIRFLAARSLDHDRRGDGAIFRRHVWLAYCHPARGETRMTIIDNLEQILEWDLQSMATGHLPRIGHTVNEPIEFVCTHSKRDTCCAVLGRDRVASVPKHLRTQVWECSHLGGHRFAATSLFLPSGRLYGRLAEHCATTSGPECEPHPRHLRGPSYLPAPLQAAECAVRIEADLMPTTELQVSIREESDAAVVAEVSTSSGERWLVRCEPHSVTSPASCGAESTSRSTWQPTLIERRF